MPNLLPGYSRQIISRNIAELYGKPGRRTGLTQKQAVKLAYDSARRTGGVLVPRRAK
jgi:hypothetical protein